jgi:hypothetical protein
MILKPENWAPLARLPLCFKQRCNGCQGNPPGKRAVQSRAAERIEVGVKDLTKRLVRRSDFAILVLGDRGKLGHSATLLTRRPLETEGIRVSGRAREYCPLTTNRLAFAVLAAAST